VPAGQPPAHEVVDVVHAVGIPEASPYPELGTEHVVDDNATAQFVTV
jgi:hypothetical protein